MGLSSGKVKADSSVKGRARKGREIKLCLPHEIIIEILSCLPVNSLLRLQAVSKHWCTTIKDRWFVTEHHQRASRITYLYEPQEEEGNGTFVLEAYTSNFLLERKQITKKYRIRNPFTREILDLPIPYRSYNEYKTILAEIPNSDYLKAIKISTDRYKMICFEVLTVNIDEYWRPLKLPKPRKLGRFIIVEVKRLLVVHCIWFLDGGGVRIESLDVDNECFYSSTLPPQGLNEVSVIEWRGRGSGIAFAEIDFVNEVFNAVVLEDYKKQKWSDGKIEVPLPFLKGMPDVKMKKSLRPSYAVDDQLWFYLKQDSKHDFLYHIESGILERFDRIDEANQYCWDMKESMVTLKGMPAPAINL